MNTELNNELYGKEMQRWLRAVNEKTGEYYDTPIATGTNCANRQAIADHIRTISTTDVYGDNQAKKFPWTKIILHNRSDGKHTHNNGEWGVTYLKRKKNEPFTYWQIDENMEPIEETKTVVPI